MANNGDFIKINRSLLNWGWFTDDNTLRMWIYILLKANWADCECRGVIVPRGSFMTSYPKMSAETGMSIQQIRTCISKLERTGEISKKSTANQQVITVEKYDDYQLGNGKPNRRATGEQQGINTQNKNIQEDKERKNKELYINNTNSDVVISNRNSISNIPTIAEVQEYITLKGYHFRADDFWHYYNKQGWKLNNGLPMKDWHSACVTWEKRERPKIEKKVW